MNSISLHEQWWKFVWSSAAPPKVGPFCWLILKGKLPVKEELSRRGILYDSNALILRMALWGKAKWQNLNKNILDIFRWPQVIKIQPIKHVIRSTSCWEKPAVGCLKFNVDGSEKGQPGSASIGGVLRDHDANIKLVFSKSVGVADSNLAEVLAIREAFVIFSYSPWATAHTLIIESDSMNAVKWIKNPISSPWRIRGIITHIEFLKH
ncbi:hypothetical protein DITRI_Ditri19aG0099600 [Diplodiscus trichospermus]